MAQQNPMTRTTRRYLIARLTQLGGSRRIWSLWLKRAFDHYCLEMYYLADPHKRPIQLLIHEVQQIINAS